MIAVLFALLARSTAILLFAALFLVLVGLALTFESARGLAWLRRHAWFRRFETLPPRELRYRGMVSLGLGLCCFAAMLTVELILPGTPVHRWFSPWGSIGLGVIAVAAITLGAAFLERAASLEGWR